MLDKEDFDGFGIWILLLLSSFYLSSLGLKARVIFWAPLLLIISDLFVGDDFNLMVVPPTGAAIYCLDYPGFLRALMAL